MSKEKAFKALQFVGTSIAERREFLYKELSRYFNNSDYYSFTELTNKFELVLDEINSLENKINVLNTLNNQIQQALLANQPADDTTASEK